MSENAIATRPVYELQALSSKEMFIQTVGEDGERKFKIEAAFAIQALRGNEYLQKCNPQSITDAVVNVALTGTTLNPALHFAYLVPRDGKCCLDISYRGLAKIATDSKAVLAIEAQVVMDKDAFDYEYGLEPKLRHVPCLEADRGKITHAYMIAHLASGIKTFHVMGKNELDKTRATAKTQYVWKQWEDEMCRKTVVKRGYKLLPQTDQMSLAIAVINDHEGIEIDQKKDTSLSPAKVKQAVTRIKAAIKACKCAEDVAELKQIDDVVVELMEPHDKEEILNLFAARKTDFEMEAQKK